MEDSVDELTSKARESFLSIQKLLEQKDPTVFEAFNDCYQIAIDALDLQEVQMNDTKHESENLMDEISSKLEKLGNLSEDVTQFEEEIKRAGENIEKHQKKIDEQKQINDNLKIKLQKRRDLIPEIKSIVESIEKIKVLEVADKETEEIEKKKQQDLQNQIDLVRKQANDMLIRSKSLLKKSQMKVTELEQKIKKSSSNNNLVLSPKSSKPIGPSMIIHKTQDSAADELRLLRASMEEALRTNSMLKAQIKNIEQDLAACREENAALKALTKNVLDKNK